MPFDRFFIGPINSGLQTDLKPFLIPDDAFTQLQNAYVFRGRVKKRFGTQLMGSPQNQLTSRLRINIGTTDAAGNLALTNLPGSVLNIGAAFSAGSIIFTVTVVPTIVGNTALTLSTDGTATGTVKYQAAGPPKVYQFSVGGGQIAIANTIVYFYPALPVMGITQYLQNAVNNHPTYAYDTEFAYKWTSAGWVRSGTGVAPQWNSAVLGKTNTYMYSSNWQNTGATAGNPTLFATNFQVTNLSGAGAATDDPIWWTNDGTTWLSITTAAANGFYFKPAGGARTSSPFVVTAKIVLPFKNRLILLNTVENDNGGGFGAGTNTNFPQRCRYSFNGSPFANNAWYEPNQTDAAGATAAGAGFIDAATEEQIIAAEFIKDRLIVYFERSTWELAYTGSEVLPFIWQKINTELGAMSTFSSVPFDKEVLAIGASGVHSCNGANVARIDNKIPDEIFDFFSNNTVDVSRIAGIRDYYKELVYWIFVSAEEDGNTNQNFGNQILVYNYQNNSWAINDDCFTAFGYFEQGTDLTWAGAAGMTWQSLASQNWLSFQSDANKRQILAGTPEGFILIINSNISRNAPSMQITNITLSATALPFITAINHNFVSGDFVLIENIAGDANCQLLNNNIYQILVNDANSFYLYNPTTFPTAGTYIGGGTLARVSQIQIQTKWFNPYISKDRNFFLHRIDFGVTRTKTGQITIDYYPSSSKQSMVEDALATGSILGNSVLETSAYPATFAPLESLQEILWHPIYFQVSTETIQLNINLTPAQMLINNIALVDFELQGMILYTKPTSQRLQ